ADATAMRLAAPNVDTQTTLLAAHRLAIAGAAFGESRGAGDATALNTALIAAEHALLLSGGLPQRPWYRHAIYAPARDSGYGAAALPGIQDAVESGDGATAAREIAQLTSALDRAAAALEGVSSVALAKTKLAPAAPLTVSRRQKPGDR